MTARSGPGPERTTAVIIGAGFGGVAMGIELRRAGVHDFVILERAPDLGGVWRDNTYPGAGCDVPSPLYSFSFERHQRWPRRYAQQRDIHAYLDRVARKHGVVDHVRFQREVVAATFDESTARWRVRTATGEELSAAVLIPAVGQLSRPAYPAIPGIDSFRGAAFHSARWDHDVDLTGRRVAVIGTGASAIQFVPEIQPRVGRLTVFQRSAPYILPKRDHDYASWPHRAFQVLPPLQALDRLGFWLYAEFAQQCLAKWQGFVPLFRWQTTRHLRAAVPDPALRARLTPDYEIGCKRVLFSNDYLPALTRAGVELVTEPITEIAPTGVRTAGGTEHPADVIIYGTGFATLDLLGPVEITGLGGRRLSAAWHAGARAHLGITVPGFPNMFLMYGPNTNLGGGSIIHVLESQARYIRQAVRRLVAHPGHYLDVRTEVERRWDDEVQRRLARSVWTRCRSWYRNEHGRVVANWPGRTGEYRRRTRRFDVTDYRIGAASGSTSDVDVVPERSPKLDAV
ncbi:Predicted flavoprotein CzcO associated with the cation diffusion facilitator CzcD [Amycolatopsis arida]|uniref:Predicted flavoprotein CzcO associated with the cation diffusion facilitator CzcD n=1 Tax=Amycolatopsis arida TaxID=587909 RepID=A0A1I5YZ49_9PSEU|nr:NAD(P)/FAD-dependent oxidoreductase [Amycolatopsis arida]TDX89994.1 cation diffusion facilitator CzcD-associated flavoprotein CzcO [Amycolatopsis arida]SFQ49492.1 Predicted flavoprotein CzcO associated with the cation diffusion facilitator CzcD [Amycolatopsis arida]